MSQSCNRDFDVSQFEQFVRDLMDEFEAPGVAGGIIRGGRVIYSRGFDTRS